MNLRWGGASATAGRSCVCLRFAESGGGGVLELGVGLKSRGEHRVVGGASLGCMIFFDSRVYLAAECLGI